MTSVCRLHAAAGLWASLLHSRALACQETLGKASLGRILGNQSYALGAALERSVRSAITRLIGKRIIVARTPRCRPPPLSAGGQPSVRRLPLPFSGAPPSATATVLSRVAFRAVPRPCSHCPSFPGCPLVCDQRSKADPRRERERALGDDWGAPLLDPAGGRGWPLGPPTPQVRRGSTRIRGESALPTSASPPLPLTSLRRRRCILAPTATSSSRTRS